ncbi:hypothetical protein [Asticcacaulis benevestitus]|uniref:Uncharacterized protein n=1 Tax=Asticcacaulis benevestitus DSM 16100 = ATCC BAA-896 TaxID=1121022 RepID=V4PZK7_9CAUL|nr:hypothetical protein [Asticcacaulis benevestitus]ESQ92869.1 hypothetical protein ABENE_07130 [Asticcacaulis benevestitus DSM 16100 = ATCC BAA-896]
MKVTVSAIQGQWTDLGRITPYQFLGSDREHPVLAERFRNQAFGIAIRLCLGYSVEFVDMPVKIAGLQTSQIDMSCQAGRTRVV